MTSVTVLRDRYVRSWPDKPDKPVGERAYVLPLRQALTRTYSRDAHFTLYETPNGRRLSREALAHSPVKMTCVAFDLDCHGASEPALDAWRGELRAKMAALHEDHPDPYYYETRGGARIVYALPEPFTIVDARGEQLWRRLYAVALAYLSRRYAIEADPACGDWTRLFRLPCATRDPAIGPEQRLTVGDAGNIGALKIQASSSDVERAMQITRAFDTRRDLAFEPCAGADGEGLLFHALSARGAVARQHDGRSFVIRCPNESAHSSGRTADGSTLLYRPAAGEQVGAICCLHAHCSSMRVADWLRLFSRSELETARHAAGIRRSA